MSDIPNKKAAALKYNPSDRAPKIIASGQGFLAEKIVQKGESEGVHIYEDKELVEVLTKVNIGDTIPPELYEVVAKILIFIDDLDRGAGASKYVKL